MKDSKGKDRSKNISIDPDVAACIDSMVTQNRLDNVISKIGEVTRADFGTLMKDLNCDVLEEFPEKYENVHTSIDEKSWPKVKKYLNTKCSALIGKYFATNAS